MSSHTDRLESLASQYGMQVSYMLETYGGPVYTVVASVNGTSYRETHYIEQTACQMAARSAIRGLQQQLQTMTRNPNYYIHGQPSTHSRPQQPRSRDPVNSRYHEASQSREHYRMELNNAAVMWGLAVSYELESCTGPAHNPEWVSTVFVGESPRAVGYGKSKSAAKEQAAKIALEVMHDLGYRHPSRS